MGASKDYDQVKKFFNSVIGEIEDEAAHAELMSKKCSDKVSALSGLSEAIHAFLLALEDLEKLESEGDE